MRRLKKQIFLGLCAVGVIALAVVRWTTNVADGLGTPVKVDTLAVEPEAEPIVQEEPLVVEPSQGNKFAGSGNHRVRGVHSYSESFPDLQEVQIEAAQKFGIQPLRSRDELAGVKGKLLYVGENPYYEMDGRMTHSVPYLVPRASLLLEDIGHSFMDSLAVKGKPLHRLVVTSVLRTEEDVQRLTPGNKNASKQSCHRYGTTFDIGYYRYSPVTSPDGKPYREVGGDTLLWVLSEVLRDFREQGRCYVKYEKKQSCFHITTR